MILEILAQAGAVAATGFGGPGGIWAHIVNDFSNITEPAALSAFLQVLMIDIVLAGDNAIVVGALAAGLPADQRRKVIFIGVIAALVLRIAFALIVTQLMQIVGLSLTVSLSAVLGAAVIGLPLGALIALVRYPGREASVVTEASSKATYLCGLFGSVVVSVMT